MVEVSFPHLVGRCVARRIVLYFFKIHILSFIVIKYLFAFGGFWVRLSPVAAMIWVGRSVASWLFLRPKARHETEQPIDDGKPDDEYDNYDEKDESEYSRHK